MKSRQWPPGFALGQPSVQIARATDGADHRAFPSDGEAINFVSGSSGTRIILRRHPWQVISFLRLYFARELLPERVKAGMA
jgi:hypothetical protein